MSNCTTDFRCDHCGGVFAKMISDEESMMAAKSRDVAPIRDGDELGIVCDPCFKAFVEWYDSLPPEDSAKSP